MTTKPKPPIATYHFRVQLSCRFKIADCPPEVQKEIVTRIQGRMFSRCRRGDKKGLYKYDLYTEGLLKAMLPSIPDRIRVVYDWNNSKLVTVIECD